MTGTLLEDTLTGCGCFLAPGLKAHAMGGECRGSRELPTPMKISFNETSLQTMFEYPSESSLVEEEEEEEEEYATEVDEKPAFRIPHPSSTVNSNPVNSGLSGYTPKHSLGFNKWQEQQHQKLPSTIGALSQETDQLEQQVMLTPAEKSHLSDFSSEPALYF